MRSYFMAGLATFLSLAVGVNGQTPENCLNDRALEKVVEEGRTQIWMAGCSLDDSDWGDVMNFLDKVGDLRANIERINLSHNAFTRVPGKLLEGFSDKLEYLSLNSNELTRLPNRLFSPAGVGENPKFVFYANINNLTTLPQGIFRNKLPGFRQLELRHNNLGALPRRLFENVNVPYLKIDGNPNLECLPKQKGTYSGKRQTDGGVGEC